MPQSLTPPTGWMNNDSASRRHLAPHSFVGEFTSMRPSRLSVGITHSMKANLVMRTGKKCAGCGFRFTGHAQQLAREQGALELDHKVPLERGGTNALHNLQVLCLPCHDGKTNCNGKTGKIRNMTDAEWRASGSPQDWTRKRVLIQGRQSKRSGRRKSPPRRP